MPNASGSVLTGSDCHSTWCVAARALTLLIAVVFAGCAQRETPVVWRMGPSLCKEGPPSWRTSDGRQLMYRTWGPTHRVPRAVVVGRARLEWNGRGYWALGSLFGRARNPGSTRRAFVDSMGSRPPHSAQKAMLMTAVSGSGTFRNSSNGRRRHQGTPLFLYGQSMGSLTAILVLREMDHSDQLRVSGIILHSPAVAMMYASPVLRFGVGRLRDLNPKGLLFNVGLISGEKPALTNDPSLTDTGASRRIASGRDSPGRSLMRL